jgi:hypothetical protein
MTFKQLVTVSGGMMESLGWTFYAERLSVGGMAKVSRESKVCASQCGGWMGGQSSMSVVAGRPMAKKSSCPHFALE